MMGIGERICGETRTLINKKYRKREGLYSTPTFSQCSYYVFVAFILQSFVFSLGVPKFCGFPTVACCLEMIKEYKS